MTYKAKTITGAERRVRELQRDLRRVRKLLAEYASERRALARLAAETPQFSNPLDVWEAKAIRDRILSASQRLHTLLDEPAIASGQRKG